MLRRYLALIVIIFFHISFIAFAQETQDSVSRFKDNRNGTVTDTETNLMWQMKDDGEKRTYDEAVKYCKKLKLAGYSDWRLPAPNEYLPVEALVQPRKSKEMVDYYWSNNPTQAIPLNYFPSHMVHSNLYGIPKTALFYVRCIRSILSEGRKESSINKAETQKKQKAAESKETTKIKEKIILKDIKPIETDIEVDGVFAIYSDQSGKINKIDGEVTVIQEGSFLHRGGGLSGMPAGSRFTMPSGAKVMPREQIRARSSIPKGTEIWLPKGTKIDYTYSLWLPGTTHEIKGKIEDLGIKGYMFESDINDPLIFKLIKDIGYVYQKGRGTISSPDGKIYTAGEKDKIILHKEKKEPKISPEPTTTSNHEEKNKELAMSYWNQLKAKYLNELKALEEFFKKYSKYGQAVPDLERLLIDHLKENKKAMGKRFILNNILVDKYNSLTAVTATQSPSGMLELKGNVEHMVGGGENMLGHGAIHRWKGTIRDMQLPNINGGVDTYTFIGDEDDPLTFGCIYGVGWVYLHGKGKVKLPNGKEVILGDLSEDEREWKGGFI